MVLRIGYANSSRIARRALLSGLTVKSLILEEALLTEEELNELLQPENMIAPTRAKS
ncbi:hypothetical protein [Marinomonas aquimarina]|uniref:hypothetical protein n=1 Tax=Marinomonas aquimarina TaxID=295068 RepID=UPI0022B23AAB|nr:hypothetical protein [Marinomonas aquimarina]